MSQPVNRIKEIVENYKSLYESSREIKYILAGDRNINHEYFQIVKSKHDIDLGMCLKTVLHRDLVPDKIQNAIFEKTLEIQNINKNNNKNFFITIYDDYSVKDDSYHINHIKNNSDVKWVVSYKQDNGDFIIVWPYDRDHLGYKLRSILERNNIKENIRQKIMISINDIYLREENPRYIHITKDFYVYNKPGIEVKSNV